MTTTAAEAGTAALRILHPIRALYLRGAFAALPEVTPLGGDGEMDDALKAAGLTAHQRLDRLPELHRLTAALAVLHVDGLPMRLTLGKEWGNPDISLYHGGEDTVLFDILDKEAVLTRFVREMDRVRQVSGDAPGHYVVETTGSAHGERLDIQATGPRQAARLAAALFGLRHGESQAVEMTRIRSVCLSFDPADWGG